ncbi:hypothetical protein CEXT_469431 [Caerostris extrusa]|uniref:Uncharacterized protein n=1 Tax=Caerostris extrusa TaxID=172846 RepID=A0AAV4WR94_CAEEX|nr:hypothetical protein CEXT_469431 [Caerostris extrusa]
MALEIRDHLSRLLVSSFIMRDSDVVVVIVRNKASSFSANRFFFHDSWTVPISTLLGVCMCVDYDKAFACDGNVYRGWVHAAEMDKDAFFTFRYSVAWRWGLLGWRSIPISALLGVWIMIKRLPLTGMVHAEMIKMLFYVSLFHGLALGVVGMGEAKDVDDEEKEHGKKEE